MKWLLPVLLLVAACSAPPKGPQVLMTRTLIDVSHCGATYGSRVREGCAPVYPVSLAQGAVLVEINVGKDGVPVDVKVRKSSGHADLDEAAVTAARTFRYERAMQDVIQFHFRNE